jgi:hypothetical protein
VAVGGPYDFGKNRVALPGTERPVPALVRSDVLANPTILPPINGPVYPFVPRAGAYGVRVPAGHTVDLSHRDTVPQRQLSA